MIIGISGKMQSGKNTVASIIQYLTHEYEIHGQITQSFNDFIKLKYDNDAFKWKQKAFASKLKQIVSILTGIPVEDLEKQEVKDRVLGEEWNRYRVITKGFPNKYVYNRELAANEVANAPTIKRYVEESMTVRQLLQEIGTEAMRDVIHPNVWVNALFADYNCSCGHTLSDKDISHVEFDICKEPNWIITDVRFPNEMQAIKDRDGVTIRVNRYCYDSAEDFLVCHPDKNIAKIGTDINMKIISLAFKFSFILSFSFENSSVIDFEAPARLHGYKPLAEQHSSETSLDGAEFDYVIDNNGSIEELIEKVKQVLIKEKII